MELVKFLAVSFVMLVLFSLDYGHRERKDLPKEEISCKECRERLVVLTEENRIAKTESLALARRNKALSDSVIVYRQMVDSLSLRLDKLGRQWFILYSSTAFHNKNELKNISIFPKSEVR